jgi:N6-adenosine-specific RNA methylase IME4
MACRYRYRFISADVPWPYATWNNKFGLPHRRRRGRGLASGVYSKRGTMPMGRILAMGPLVKQLAEPNAALLLWVTGPRLTMAEKVAKAWGFPHYSTILFVWVKTNSKHPKNALIDRTKDFKSGTGYWSMSNVELGLLFLRGSNPPSRASTGVRQVIVSPVGEHSEKPLEAHERFEKLMGKKGSYLDLFARRYRRNWTALGDELDDLDIFDSMQKLVEFDLPFQPRGVKEPFTPASAVEEWQTKLRPEPEEGQLKFMF